METFNAGNQLTNQLLGSLIIFYYFEFLFLPIFMDKVDVLIILNRGTLVNYFVEPSFIKVYYSSPDLEKDTYYLFTFLTSTQSLIKVEIPEPLTSLFRV